MKQILDDNTISLRSDIKKSIQHLYDLTQHIGHSGLSATIEDLLERIKEPFMFVIVGEVKAGKSSFINALLQTKADICKVAPSPMTDTIQQILYDDIAHEEIINPYLKRIYHPVPILKDVAIVDTPGTNTIIAHHQEITERFVPGADLIVFVFEAKNPYRQSSWEFFDYIHADWRKKIIFILQQKDLLPESDLQVNVDGVIKMAREKGINTPQVFAVSAKQEQEDQKKVSGFLPLRKFISKNITGGQAPILKLSSSVQTGKSIALKIQDGLDTRSRQYESDVEFREDIRKTLDKQSEISHEHVKMLVENLQAGYDQIMNVKTEELSSVLSFGSVIKRSFSSLFSKEASMKDWLSQFARNMEEDLNGKLRHKLNERILDLAEAIQQMGQIIDLKIRSSKTILKDDNEIFSDIAEKRSRVLTELQETFTSFLQESENFKDQSILQNEENMSPALATGSGIAVVGVLLTIITNGMVFDITGGVITTIGLLFAGISMGLQKRKIMRHFKTEVQGGRIRLGQEVTEKLVQYVHFIREQFDGNFKKFDQLLIAEKQALDELRATLDAISQELHGYEKQLVDKLPHKF